MSQHHLARLFERFRTQGSTAALARVFDETAPALFAVARRIVRERADAEDAVQATFLVAIERAATWDAERPLEPWLFGILVRQLGLARRKAARVVDPQRLDTERLEDPTLDVERSELVATVAEAVQQLPEHDRAVLEPWLFDELRGSDLARRAGVTGSTLRMRLRRGLARLRRALPAGLGATAVVLSAADRSALAHAKSNLLAAAASHGGGAGATAAAATGAATSFGVKAAAAALLAAAVLGGGALLRARQEASEPAARSAANPAQPRDGSGASDAATAVALSPSRQRDERGSASDPAGRLAATTVTVGVEGKELSGADALTGIVVDARGEPVGGANVFVFDDDARGIGMLATAESAADGTFRFERLDARGVHVAARKDGIGRAATQTAPMAARARLVLGAGARFEGRVIDERGMPVPAASVELADDDARFVGTQHANSDTDGRYLFESVRGRVRYVRAVAKSPLRFGFTVLDPGDDRSSAPSEVVVRATRRVALSVVARGDGQPVANAHVIVRAGGDALGTAGLDVRGGRWLDVLEPFWDATSTDAAGRVELDDVPDCEACSVAIAAPGFAPTVRAFSTAGDTPVVERVELEPACTVEGVVRRADGTPVADAIVEVETATPLRELRASPGSLDLLRSLMVDVASPFALATRSHPDGTFALAGLPPLPACNLRVESERRVDYAWIDALSAGETRRDVVVTFGAKVRIEGTLVAEDGAAPADTKLWLQPASSLAPLDPDGRFSFELAPHGTATIWAVAPGYVHARCDVSAPLPASSQVALTLRRGASIAGSVVDAQKRAVAGARLIVWPAEPTFEERRKTGGWISEMNLASGTTRDDGGFEIRGLPARALRLVVSADGFTGGELTPIEPGSANLSVTLRPAR
jgi:RNA polymerase sigma factor (sigma-70 family)